MNTGKTTTYLYVPFVKMYLSLYTIEYALTYTISMLYDSSTYLYTLGQTVSLQHATTKEIQHNFFDKGCLPFVFCFLSLESAKNVTQLR